jgi:Zn-dependent peptidase ImmA (M78 family)
MNERYQLYQQMHALAHQKRKEYAIETSPIDLLLLKKIYKNEGIKIHYSDGGIHSKFKNLRAAYFNDEDGCDVIVNKNLPREARIFSLTHELKHHYIDKDRLGRTVPCCLSYNDEPLMEICAQVFAAEFIWPEDHFIELVRKHGISLTNWSPDAIVYFKFASKMPVSYTFIVKRLERLIFIPKGACRNVKFRNLEYQLLGQPYYMRFKSIRK